MSRPLGVIEEQPQQGLDFGAMMLSEEPRFYQLDLEDPGGGGNTAIGQALFDLEGNHLGRLVRAPFAFGGANALGLQGPDGVVRPFQAGEYLNAFNVGLSVDGTGNIVGSRALPLGGSGSAAAPAFSGTQAAQQAAFAHDEAMARLQDELAAARAAGDFDRQRELQLEILEKQQIFQEEQAALNREFQARESRLGVVQGLIQARIGERQAAREQGVTLAGTDPLRALGMLRARAISGPTPFDIFKGELAGAARFKSPKISPDASIQDLEDLIGRLEGSILPENQPIFGMARGGRANLQPGEGILVGEGERGEGIEAGTAELLEMMPDGSIRVIPISGGAARGGAFKRMKTFGFEALSDLFSRTRLDLGLGGRIADPGTKDFRDVGNVLSRSQAARLGGFQRTPGSLIQREGGRNVFIVDERGRLRPFQDRYQLGQSEFADANIETVSRGELRRFDRGRTVGRGFELDPAQNIPFGAMGQPLNLKRGFREVFVAQGLGLQDANRQANRLANLIGQIPAPHVLAPMWGSLKATEKGVLLSTYKLMGISRQEVLSQMTATRIPGMARTATGIG